MKKVFILICVVSGLTVSAQDCSVTATALKGSYSGDCKKGRAHGKGVATGEDKYEGSFINGLPDGQGEYTWKNGDVYKGSFSKGLKHGAGKLIYRQEGKPDSIVTGYWKKDKYYGINENPYTIWFKSRKIGEVDIDHRDGEQTDVTFFVTPTYTVPSADETTKIPIAEILMIKGTHGKVLQNNIHTQKSETIITELTMPARMRVTVAGEEMDIEFHLPGTYIINLKLHR